MSVITPAPGVIGGISLLTAVEFICAVHLIICIAVISMVSLNSVDYAGVRISGYFQCMIAAWCLLGIPMTIIGGVGAVFRVEKQLKAYLWYLVGTMVVVFILLGIMLRYGSACSTIQPMSAEYKSQALMVCQASNGMIIFWMLVVCGLIAGAIYLVWSMMQYVQNRLLTELLRYQEPWQAAVQLADDAAEAEAREHRFTAFQQQRLASTAPGAFFYNPDKITQPSNQVPIASSMHPSFGTHMQGQRMMDPQERAQRRGVC